MHSDESATRGGLNRAELLRRGAAGVAGLTVLGAVSCGDDDDGGSTGTATAQEKPPSAPTGTLRVGLPAGVAGVIADPTTGGLGFAGAARADMINDKLVDQFAGELQMKLATEVEGSTDAKTWDITLRDGVQFTDGKPMRPEDVLASIKYFQRKASSVAFQFAIIEEATKTGPNSVRVSLATPDALFIERLASQLYVLPEDYDPKKPVGTGPFSLQSIDSGKKTVMAANPNYWGDGPYVETLELYEFADDAARVNALLAKQVDGIDSVPTAQVTTVDKTSGLSVLKAAGDTNTPLAMNTQAEPFNDPRVRQAMRLILDRSAVITQVFSGLATIGNDVSDPLGPDYVADTFPQREQDIEQAKSLLKAAGKEDLTVELNTSPVGIGAVELCQVFAEQAKAAGVTVKLKQIDPAQYFVVGEGSGWLSYPFSASIGGSIYIGYLANVSSTLAPGGYAPETHWEDEEWQRLYAEAIVTVDKAKRDELSAQLQRIDYDRGGYIVAAFNNTTTGHSDKLKGLDPKCRLGMNQYRFDTLWIS